MASEEQEQKKDLIFSDAEAAGILVSLLVMDSIDLFEFGIPATDLISWAVQFYQYKKGTSGAFQGLVGFLELIPGIDYLPLRSVAFLLLLWGDRHPDSGAAKLINIAEVIGELKGGGAAGANAGTEAEAVKEIKIKEESHSPEASKKISETENYSKKDSAAEMEQGSGGEGKNQKQEKAGSGGEDKEEDIEQIRRDNAIKGRDIENLERDLFEPDRIMEDINEPGGGEEEKEGVGRFRPDQDIWPKPNPKKIIPSPQRQEYNNRYNSERVDLSKEKPEGKKAA